MGSKQPIMPAQEEEAKHESRVISHRLSPTMSYTVAKWKNPKMKQAAIINRCLEAGFEQLEKAKANSEYAQYDLSPRLKGIYTAWREWEQEQKEMGIDPAQRVLITDLINVAKKHSASPEAKAIREVAQKIEDGTFTAAMVDVTKKETGEKGVVRMDSDDADQILDEPIILNIEDDPDLMLNIIKKRLKKRQKGGKKHTFSIEVVGSLTPDADKILKKAVYDTDYSGLIPSDAKRMAEITQEQIKKDKA